MRDRRTAQCVDYIVSNDLKENAHKRREKLSKFGAKFCPSCHDWVVLVFLDCWPLVSLIVMLDTTKKLNITKPKTYEADWRWYVVLWAARADPCISSTRAIDSPANIVLSPECVASQTVKSLVHLLCFDSQYCFVFRGSYVHSSGFQQRTVTVHACATVRLSWKKSVLVEINGALCSSAYQYSSKVAHSLQCLFLCLLGTRWFA